MFNARLGDELDTLISWTHEAELSSPLSTYFVYPAHTTVRSPSPFRQRPIISVSYLVSFLLPMSAMWHFRLSHYGPRTIFKVCRVEVDTQWIADICASLHSLQRITGVAMGGGGW